MSEQKDRWDKLEIFGKILTPVVVGLMLLVWNSQRTTQQTAAAMTQIATGILREEPANDHSDSALRKWAIEVLKQPSSVPQLSDEAALQLQNRALPSTGLSGPLFGLDEEDMQTLKQTLESLEQLKTRPLGEDLQ